MSTHKIWLIAKKEIAFYLNNPVGYIIAALFLVVSSFFFFNDFFVVGVVSQKSFFDLTPWLMLFFIAGLTMRSFSEEKRLNTIELWLTLPIQEYEIVLGKFFGLALLLGGTLLLTTSLSLSLLLFGKPFIPELIVNYLGLYLFGLLLITLGNFLSLLTNNQVVSLLVTLVVFVVTTLIGTDTVTRYFPTSIGDILTYISPLYHLAIFSRGVIALRSVVYFISLMSILLIATTNLLKTRR